MSDFSNIWDVVKKIDFIAFSALALAGRTFYVQQFGVEVIVYPYQEKHGDYGIAIENIGKGTAIDYTFKVLGYDENTEPEIKNFLDTYKLLNGEARITLAGGKIHKIKIENQTTITQLREEQIAREAEAQSQAREAEAQEVREANLEYFPTIEIQVQKRKHYRQYKIITRSTVCDLKAFDGYPYTEDPLDVLRRDLNHQAEKKAQRDRLNRGLESYRR